MRSERQLKDCTRTRCFSNEQRAELRHAARLTVLEKLECGDLDRVAVVAVLCHSCVRAQRRDERDGSASCGVHARRGAQRVVRRVRRGDRHDIRQLCTELSKASKCCGRRELLQEDVESRDGNVGALAAIDAQLKERTRRLFDSARAVDRFRGGRRLVVLNCTNAGARDATALTDAWYVDVNRAFIVFVQLRDGAAVERRVRDIRTDVQHHRRVACVKTGRAGDNRLRRERGTLAQRHERLDALLPSLQHAARIFEHRGCAREQRAVHPLRWHGGRAKNMRHRVDDGDEEHARVRAHGVWHKPFATRLGEPQQRGTVERGAACALRPQCEQQRRELRCKRVGLLHKLCIRVWCRSEHTTCCERDEVHAERCGRISDSSGTTPRFCLINMRSDRREVVGVNGVPRLNRRHTRFTSIATACDSPRNHCARASERPQPINIRSADKYLTPAARINRFHNTRKPPALAAHIDRHGWCRCDARGRREASNLKGGVEKRLPKGRDHAERGGESGRVAQYGAVPLRLPRAVVHAHAVLRSLYPGGGLAQRLDHRSFVPSSLAVARVDSVTGTQRRTPRGVRLLRGASRLTSTAVPHRAAAPHRAERRLREAQRREHAGQRGRRSCIRR